jgi:hypothetical protein
MPASSVLFDGASADIDEDGTPSLQAGHFFLDEALDTDLLETDGAEYAGRSPDPGRCRAPQ